MKTFALLAVFLLGALFTLSDADAGAMTRQANSNGSVCRRCRLWPPLNQRVCTFNGVRTRTFRSKCLAERRACQTGWDITVVSQGPCPKPARIPGGQQQQGGDTKSSESLENLSIEWDDGVNIGIPTMAQARTTVMPTQPPTSPQTIPTLRTNGPPPPIETGSTQSPDSLMPSSKAPGKTVPANGASTASTSPATATSATVRQCPSFNTCVPSSSVCGTDGTTYPSQCVLEVLACMNKLDTLTVAYAGPCTL